MHPDIENLINMALADGELTEKEKFIILRKAESLGLDKDEIEMIIDGKAALMKKVQSDAFNKLIPKDNKDGVLKKCPQCGAASTSFSTNCRDCGHEFRNRETNSTITKLSEQLQLIDKEVRIEYFERKNLEEHHSVSETNIEVLTNQRKVSLINSFPLPITKEDILEFLVLSIPLATQKIPFMHRMYPHKTILRDAWFAKAKEVIMKARLSMREDKSTLHEIENYAKLLGVK